jgi:hypothetical protein
LVPDNQDDFTFPPSLDQPDETDRSTVAVVCNEEPATLIEEVRQDRYLSSIYRLCDEPGHAA